MKHVWLFLMTLMLAGCTDDGPETNEALVDEVDLSPETISFEGSDTAQAMPLVAIVYVGVPAGQFKVAENVTAMLVEAKWTCAHDPCPLELWTADEDSDEFDSASGDGYARIVMDDPQQDVWYAWLNDQNPGAHVGAEATFMVTFFYDGPVDEDFTAFE